MNKVTVQPGQTLLDIAIQSAGSAEASVLLAQLNGLGVTDVLTAGMVLDLPDVIDKRVVRVYSIAGYVPASQFTTESVSITLPIHRYTIRTTSANVAVAKSGQRLIDIAIQYLGSPEGVISLAQFNGISVGASLLAGTVLQLPSVANIEVVNYFLTGGYEPATDTEGDVAPGGIGYMAVVFDFKVGL